MKKINNITEYAFIKNISNDNVKKIVSDTAILMEKEGFSLSSIRRRTEVIIDIVETHNLVNAEEVKKLCEKYYSKGIGAFNKLSIRYGEERAKEYEEKLKNRPKPKNIVTHFSTKYWIEKGLTEDEALDKVKKIQSSNAKRRKKSSYENMKNKLKWSKNYWISKGYSYEQSILLSKENFISNNTLEYYIEKYGKDGEKLWNERKQKRKSTWENGKENHRSGGYVSKASLKFFIPIYKKIRKLGINRKDIYFGINGSKEFFIRHKGNQNAGRFFDFSIPKLNIVIEYNGTYWHPKTKDTWKNSFISYDDAIVVEIEKEKLCESGGYTLIKVWDDDSLDLKQKEIVDLVRERLNESIE